MTQYADVVLILTAFLAGGVFVAFVHSLRDLDPRVNLRAQVIASVRLASVQREAARLREQLDLAWTAADRRLEYLREVASELGADVRDTDDDSIALAFDESLCLAARCRARALRSEIDRLLCPHCCDPRGSHATDGLCPLCRYEAVQGVQNAADEVAS